MGFHTSILEKAKRALCSLLSDTQQYEGRAAGWMTIPYHLVKPSVPLSEQAEVYRQRWSF